MKFCASILLIFFATIAFQTQPYQPVAEKPNEPILTAIEDDNPYNEEEPTPEIPKVCPSDMQEVDGNFCPSVIQTCKNLDMTIHNANGYVRCLEFEQTKCLSKNTRHMHFCIDIYEASGKEGDIPPVMKSWTDGKISCEKQGKRLCYDNEWTLACEGPKILPYPYGLNRDSNACNIDHPQRGGFDATNAKMDNKTVNWLDQRQPSGSMKQCVSYYGVYDMTGNVDEATINSSGVPYKSALKGGHWVMGARNRCRPVTLAHNEFFANYESSYRCCKDINESK